MKLAWSGKDLGPCLYAAWRRAALMRRGRAGEIGKRGVTMKTSKLLVTLKKNREYGFVYRRGKSFGGHYMVLLCVPRKFGGVKAGFSVSKKVGNAVVRNKARRRLKESLRLYLLGMHHAQIVLIARPPIAGADFSAIVREMGYLLRKAGLLEKREAPQKQDA